VPGRIVEVASDDRHIAVEHGFLVVRGEEEVIGRVPLDDLAGVIANAHGLTYSNRALVALAERGVPMVLCDARHTPVAFLWAAAGHHLQSARLDAQLRSTRPLAKRLWQQLVRRKIEMQALAVEHRGLNAGRLLGMARSVRSGDASNVEGRAARLYWPLIFGSDFRRDRTAGGINGLLNYGYTVLRSAVARHVMASGLHPAIPIHHANDGNPMRLVDDLIEPFRPLVDLWVRQLVDRGIFEVTSTSKRALALLPVRTLVTEHGRSPLSLVVQRLVASLVRVYERESAGLELPTPRRLLLRDFFEDPDGEPVAS
jgi:CRISPR-associated protein Cas1